jgi:peptidoglycan/xylan/chitin deacetylase (PgdA/CDA1 family)
MLKRIGKNLIINLLLLSGIVKIRRWLFQKKKVTILLLHDPTPEAFRSLAEALKNTYHFISMETFVEAKQSGNWHLLPKYPAIFTLDDGHKNNYLLLDEIKQFSVPVTIYICASIIDSHRHFWSNYDIPKAELEHLKTLPGAEMLAQLKKAGYEKEREYPTRHALSLNEIKEMQASGLVDFQSHTCLHPILTQVSATESKHEIEHSKKLLEATLQKDIAGFAYPNGNYGARELSYTEEAGYKYAVTVDEGFNTAHTNNFKLKRICLNDEGSVKENVIKANGLWRFLKF